MKTIKKQGKVVCLLVALAAFTACSDEEVLIDDSSIDPSALSSENVELEAQTDAAADDILSVADIVYANDELESDITGRDHHVPVGLPDCVTITTVVTSTSKEKTIDFGEGCELANGNVLSGIIFMSYSKDMEAATKEISLSFQDFTFNDIQVEGGKSVLRERSNENGNPQSTATVDILLTWPEGETASRVGTRVVEWIEGFGSGFWGDNVFEVTGNRTTTFKDGSVHSGVITTALRKELACRFIVSGVVELTRNDTTVTVDYGDGSCDNKATLTTADGEVVEINLRKGWRF